MKKFLNTVIIAALSILLVSCNNETNPSGDNTGDIDSDISTTSSSENWLLGIPKLRYNSTDYYYDGSEYQRSSTAPAEFEHVGVVEEDNSEGVNDYNLSTDFESYVVEVGSEVYANQEDLEVIYVKYPDSEGLWRYILEEPENPSE